MFPRAPLHIARTRIYTNTLQRFPPSRLQSTSTIPVTQTCPSPTCACAATPADLDIDRAAPLLNTMAAYAQHVVVCTGKEDWSSNIEQEEGGTGEFVRGLKGVVGRGGEGFDPFNNILITASSLPTNNTPQNTTTTSALLFPAFKRIQAIPHDPSSLANFSSAFLKAQTLHPMHAPLSPPQKAALTRQPALTPLFATTPITTPTILICGHGSRDSRCGILGPILHAAFKAELQRRGIEGEVAQISHIGGHKYAGNVIVYVPPNAGGALAGAGVWYGRVGPEQVEGVVGETVVRGRVVGELLRGGITGEGGSLGRVVEDGMRKDGGEGEEGLRLRARARG
ncbi:hypothetical protein P153DRAFT_423297 [Dothidotthia symphoricarpi CBS 119687]|uniref:Altered inheritance of mitochondria protein 32 n=1 Tax=Dothidotthia symphoricarpi CBS 119687 TaxID=1392245 RepID=A0A6A6AB60_9PLEO|nr:uncharacterized protein P153DRAFT_423297 [Dothidotthia symphoricarpi CBS 119687]KAF2128816.1 hypothetical protein P153DRAFT_423297 [Dothidotthia symphoricarpi CBS 119687]